MAKLLRYNKFKFINESITASDLSTGDKVGYLFGGKMYRGTILDHFGDGVFLQLDSTLSYPGGEADSFELYDGENNPWGNIGMVKKSVDAFS
jgi:hypothetical protein